MKEYIEKAAIHELVKRIPKYEMFNYDRTEALLGINPDDVDFGVDKITAADVVPVVRCRKCIHWYDWGACGHLDNGFDAPPVGPDDFCSKGKRSTD